MALSEAVRKSRLPRAAHASAPAAKVYGRRGLAICFLLNLAACGAEHSEDVTSDVSATKSALRGGTVIPGATGVVDFFIGAGYGTVEPTAPCTGTMIAPNVVLTAAHCFDSLGATNTSQGTKKFTIRYYDPEQGIRVVHRGAVSSTWAVFPTYDGTGPSGPGGANDDMGIIVIPGSFEDTDYHDYVRLYADPDFYLDLDRNLTVYGAGRHTYSGATDNRLRESWFEVESVDQNHLVIDTRDLVSTCIGDSGGPFVRFATMAGVSVPTVAAVLSKGETDEDTEGTICTNNDPPNDNSFGCRVNETRIAWIERVAGISCDYTDNTANVSYRRCFTPPFIEDVAGEGMDLGTEVAVAVTLL